MTNSLYKPVDEGDGGDSDGYFDDDDDDNENQVLGFITESNQIQTQNIVKDINRGVFPEEDGMKFGSMFEFCDKTKLNTEFIPDYTKDYEPPQKIVLKKGAPKFEEGDTPGNWHPMIYKAFIPQPKDKDQKNDKYVYHRLPSGVTPIGEKHSGPVREVKGWKVHYDGSFKVNIMLLFTFVKSMVFITYSIPLLYNIILSCSLHRLILSKQTNIGSFQPLKTHFQKKEKAI